MHIVIKYKSTQNKDTILRYYDYTRPKPIEKVEGSAKFVPKWNFCCWKSNKTIPQTTYVYPPLTQEQRDEKDEIKNARELLRDQLLSDIISQWKE